MIIKILKKKFNLIKICAVFTVVCFMVSTLGANLYAIPVTENANQKYDDVFNKASSISNEYGKITSSKDAQSDVTVINIQDLHCHPQTQRNIAKIIGQIADKYNLKKVYVEGGYGDIDVSWLGSIKDENIKKKIIEELVEEGLLTGSEYYKLTSKNENVELKGIDEEKLHQENIKRLSWIIENQDKYKELGKKINLEIKFLEQRYVNIRNKRFNISIEEYLSGKLDTRRFYRQLIKYIKDINANPDEYNNVTAIRLEDYPNISKFMTLRKVSKNINVRDVTHQLQIVLNELKSKMPYATYTRLLKETENFSDSQKVVEFVTLLCEKEGIDLDNRYKSLSEFLKSNEINRDLNTVELVYEERQLITEIRKALSYNNEEYEITFVSDFSRYFQDYLEYKLNDADWKYFESGYKQFRQLYSKYATTDRIKEIESDIAELNKYYEINDIRNEIFVNNLLKDEQPALLKQSKLRQDEEILKQSKEVIIAVTGGFHSQALEEILQAKEVNTIVITPSIFEGIEKATKQYKGIIKEQSKEFQHQALAYRLLSCSKTPTQKAVMYGVLKSLLGNDTSKIKEVLGNVDLTALDNLLQNLQENNDIKFQKKVSSIKKILDIETESLIKILPKEGGKTVFFPDIDQLLLGISQELINIGIFLSDGVDFNIENSTLNDRDLKGIPAEIYSRMHPEVQKGLINSYKKDESVNLSLGFIDKINNWQFKNKIQSMAKKIGKKQEINDEYISTVKMLNEKGYDLELLLSLDKDFVGDIFYYVFWEREDISEEKIRKLKDLLDEYALKYDKNVKDLKIDILIEYCMGYLNVTKEQLDYLMKLAEELNEKNIPYIATENDNLALKIFSNDKFNSIINEKQKQYPFLNTLSAKYTIALDISRDLARRIGKIDNSDFVNLDELIEEELEDYFFKLVDSSSDRKILDSQTRVIGLFADERYDDKQKEALGLKGENLARFNPKAMKRLLSLLGFDPDDTNKYQFINSYDEKNAKELYFEKIRKIANGEKVYLLFSGHGFVDKIQVSAADKVLISVEEFANVFIELNEKGVDLSNITLDLSSCYSYFFSLKMYEILKNNGVTKFPNIWTTAGFETPLGITTQHGEYVDSNSLISLIKVAESEQKQELTGLDLFKARVESVNSNSTFFISGEKVEQINNNVEQDKIAELAKDKKDKTEKIPGNKFFKQGTLAELMSGQVANNINFEELPTTPASVSELSVFNFLSDYAHIWEEHWFRMIPSFVASFVTIALISVLLTTGFIGNIFVITLISAIPGLIVFGIAQKNFVNAHIIEDWIDTQSLSTKQKWILRIFGKFPSEGLKADFKDFYEKAKIERNNIKVATKILSVPYMLSIFLNIVLFSVPIAVPIVPIVIATTSAATITAQIYHYNNNEKAKIENEIVEIEQLIIAPEIETQNRDFELIAEIRKNQATQVFKEEKEKLKEQVSDKELKKQIEEISLEDLYANIENLNKYEFLIDKLESLLQVIKKQKNNKDWEDKFLNLVFLLCERLITEYKDETTDIHTLRATIEAVIGNNELGVENKYKLMIGGVLHDIGKNLIPDTILNKASSLTSEEYTIMKAHVWLGGIILRGSALYKFAEIAENHHYNRNEKRRYSARSLTGNSFFSKEGYELAKAFSLYDVFEAVSYKLSFDSERPYQLKDYLRKFALGLFDILKDKDFKLDVISDTDKANNIREKLAEIIEMLSIMEADGDNRKQNALIQQLIADIIKITIRDKNVYSEIYTKVDKETRTIMVLLSKIDKINHKNELIEKKVIEKEEISIKKEGNKETKRLQREIEILRKEVNVRLKDLVESIMYDPTTDEVKLELRNREIENSREESFGIIAKTDLKTVVAKIFFPQENTVEVKKRFINEPQYWQEQKQKFIKEFKNNPQFYADRILEIVNKDKTEYEEEHFRKFLRFYFNDGDKNVSNKIKPFIPRIEKFYKEENKQTTSKVLSVLSDKSKETKARFVRLDIFEEKTQAQKNEQAELNVFDIRDIVGQDVVIETKDGTIGRINVSENFIWSYEILSGVSGRDSGPLRKNDWAKYGIEDIEVDENGKIIKIKFFKDAKVITKRFGQPVGDVENNLSFEQMQEEIKPDTSSETREAAIEAIKQDTGTEEIVDIYLDDDNLMENMREAIDSGKLMIIHVFRDNVKTKDLSLAQLFERYIRAYKLLQSNKLNLLFPELNQMEQDVETERTLTLDFFLKEMLKNHFAHGNFGLFEYPIACYIAKDGSQISTYDFALSRKKYSPFEDQEFKDKGFSKYKFKTLMDNALIFGDGQGRNYMKRSKLRDFEDGNINLNSIDFYRAKVTLKKDYLDEYRKKQEESTTTEDTTTEDTTTEDTTTDKKSSEVRDSKSTKKRNKNNVSKSDLNSLIQRLQRNRFSKAQIENLIDLITTNNGKVIDEFDSNVYSSIIRALFKPKRFSIRDHRNIHNFINKLRNEEYSEIVHLQHTIKDIEEDIAKIKRDIEDNTDINFTKQIERYIKDSELLKKSIENGKFNGRQMAAYLSSYERGINFIKDNSVKENLKKLLAKNINDEEKENAKREVFEFFEKEKQYWYNNDLKKNGYFFRSKELERRLNNLIKGLDGYDDDYGHHDGLRDTEQKEIAKLKSKFGISESQIKNEINKIKTYEKIIKEISKFYAHISWNEYKRKNKKSVKVDGDGVEYIELIKGHRITLERWEHICDGHSILTNGNETEGVNRYPDSETALDSSISLELLNDGKTIRDIIEDYDIKINSNSEQKIKYIKRNRETKKVYVYIEDFDGNLVTCYVIDSKKYSDDIIGNILQTVSTKDLSTNERDNFKDYMQQNDIEIYVMRNKNKQIRGEYEDKYDKRDYKRDIVTDLNKNKFTFENSFEDIKEIDDTLPGFQEKYLAAVLPENIGFVNKILQSKFGNSLIAATVIAFKEFKASLKPNFVDLHQSEAGKQGASQLRKFITKYDIAETDTIITRIIKSILGLIFKGASIVKHITIDYKFIKASGISEAIKMFGNSTYMDDNGNVHIPPVMIVDNLEQLQDKYELRNTGIKVNGRSIYQVGEKGTLIYGAQGIDGIDVSKAINESQMIKDAIENMIRAKGYEGIKVEVEGVIQEEGEGVRFEDGITIIGNLELQNKSAEYVNGFVSSSLEIKRSIGVMYSQKALISLESIEDKEKLEQAIKQGRARKIISKSQYEQLQLTPEEIITMRENGIEIYIDDNETDESLKESGIVGQIIRKDGQIFIHDYYAQEEVEVEEIGEEDTLLNIEDKLVNSQKPILIDIKVLAKKFQKENILGVYKGLNTLIGNIKIKTGIGTINQADIENLAYNIDYNKIPDLGTLSKEKIETLSIDELIKLLNIAENSEIRIILKAIRKNKNLDEDGFVNIIKGRILAKTALEENNKEYGLKDKQMEILLGKMLLKQLGNKDKQTVNIANDFTGEKDRVMKKIMEETEKANKGEEAAINTIIEIILVYGDSYKDKQIARELDKNDARNYRAMMAAA